MTEHTLEKQEKSKNLGKTLIKIGTEIDNLSNAEFKNTHIVIVLGIVGITCLGVAVGHATKAAEFADMGMKVSLMSEAASRAELYESAVKYSEVAAENYNQASIELQTVSRQCVLMASELAVITVGEGAKHFVDGESIYYLEGKTKVSTHAGPALARIFKACGEYFDK